MNKTTVDVLIYMNPDNQVEAVTGLIPKLADVAGVVQAHLNPYMQRALMVEYDPQTISAGTILSEVRSYGCNGVLVGM